jgi:hypothetical protein
MGCTYQYSTVDDESINQQELFEKALDDFENRVLQVLGVEEDGDEESQEPTTPEQEDVAAQKASTQMPRTLSQRIGAAPANYELPQVVAAFTLDDMEKLANFGIGSSIFKTAKRAVSSVGKQVGNVKRDGLLKTVATGAGNTSGAIKGGFAGAKTAAKAKGKGRLRSNLSGVGGAVRQGMGTTGGKLAAGTAGAGAIGTGLALRPRKPKKPRI